jgi:hypothetical protein
VDDIFNIYRRACHPGAADPGKCDGMNSVVVWSARPATTPPNAPVCDTDLPGQCLSGTVCMQEAEGSSVQCGTSGPPCVCKEPAVLGFQDGAEAYYLQLQGNPDKLNTLVTLGRAYGVTPELSP